LSASRKPAPSWVASEPNSETNYRLTDPAAPFLPGTTIPRLRPVPLGERNVGYLEHEIDDLIDALAAQRDAKPAATSAKAPQVTQHFIMDSVAPLELRRLLLLDRRRTLRAQLNIDPDPEIRKRLDETDAELRALDGPTMR
jgi:hypothetical protein